MKLFISYASEQFDVADRIAIALTNEGHDVFLDSDDLRAGENYNERLRQAIDDCDLFVYLVSPESVEEGSYARIELRMARKRFRSAVGRILPVMAVPTDYADIPNYAKSVTVLEPDGDMVAAVSNRVAEIAKAGLGVVGLKTTVGGAMLFAAFGIGVYQAWLWSVARVETTGVIATVIAAGLLLVALCWTLWRRCVVRGTTGMLAIPSALLGILVAGVWAAFAFAPRVAWLVPGTTWVPLMAGPDAEYSLLLSNPDSIFESVGTTGVYLASNEQAARMIIARSSDDMNSVLSGYLDEQQVPAQFHDKFLSGWTEQLRLEGHSSRALANPEDWEASVRLGTGAEQPAVLRWRHSSSLSIAFVELN